MVVVCLLFSLVQVLLHVLAMPNRAHGYNAVTLQFLVLSSEIDFYLFYAGIHLLTLNIR